MNILARVFRRTPSLQSRVAFATGIAAAIVVGIVGTIVWIGITNDRKERLDRRLDGAGGQRADGSHYIGHAVISAGADSDEHQVRRVVLLSDVTELRRKDREMWHQANFDRLTGLPNRALLADRIDGMLRRARRNHTEVAVLFIDLDDFKPVNDDFGHDVGDLLLREVAGRLRRLLPRYQGDVVPLNLICPHRKQLSAAVRLLYEEVKAHCEGLNV